MEASLLYTQLHVSFISPPILRLLGISTSHLADAYYLETYAHVFGFMKVF